MPLMLILDVKTQWSSTHQMLHGSTLKITNGVTNCDIYSLGHALDYRAVIDDFIVKNKDLRKYEMHLDDWNAISLVVHWLRAFRSATTQISATKRSMLSSTHAIFCGLQESIQESICTLPNNVPHWLKVGLTKVH
jgi:hypothetical protein